MECVEMAVSIIGTVYSVIQSDELKEMCSMFQCKPQVERLEKTLTTIKNTLKDINSKGEVDYEGQEWVENLKDVVYDINDVLDEFNTYAQQRNQMRHAKLSKRVRRFLSRNNKFFVSYNVSREINMHWERLDDIVKNHAISGPKDVNKPVKRREETCSVISDLEVIGREDDKEMIVGMLLSNNNNSLSQFVSFLSIVGIGGLGKTTLAQLVYNDERVEGAFSKRVWVCVSEEFGIGEILGKILGRKDLPLDEMATQFKTLVEKKRYLLVLDDVWNESHDEWRKLKALLVSNCDVSGSKIIVTTRSLKVARSIGEDSTTYELKGLSEENSWNLFKRIAFGQREEQVDLVNIGEGIVKKCANVPLSIKVIASLLYEDYPDKSQWLSLGSIDLAQVCDGENGIMSTLMFSYAHLDPNLQSCFSSCSLFPKDYIIQKKMLISLWSAQGFLVTTPNFRSIKEVGERYFTTLLNRCFLQDVQFDEYGDVYSFKMHDLMRDLAVKVAGNESLTITPTTTENHRRKKIRHLSRTWGSSNMFLSGALRTYIWLESYSRSSTSEELISIVSNCARLRILSLRRFGLSTLPDNLGKLLHLRYLDISENDSVKMLPKSITQLHNLEVLNLSQCIYLEGLPEDLSKLVNLRTLDIHNCIGLSYMPRGMSNLTNLHTLTEFVVGGVDLKQTQGSKLLDLHALPSLEGDLRIRIRDFCPNNMPQATERAFLLKGAHLKNLDIRCGSLYSDEIVAPYHGLRFQEVEDIDFDQSKVHETLVEDLCPNDSIRRIGMVGFKGTKMPSWASMIMKSDMNRVQQVTSLSQFCQLKVVELEDLPNVEYIESDAAWASVSSSNEARKTFFPVLEKLVLQKMPKLKGWWRELRWMEMEMEMEMEMGGSGCLVEANDGNGNPKDHAKVPPPSFPRLCELRVEHCYNMRYFPPCPQVKRLHLMGVNDALTFCMKGAASSSSSSSSNVSVPSLCLDKLEVNNGRVFNSILRDGFVGGAVDIELTCDKTMKNLGSVKEGFERCISSLQHLLIRSWRKMNESSIYDTPYDNDHDVLEEVEEGMPWKYMQSVSSLELSHFPKMVKLPMGLKYLTSLQSLSILWCPNFEELGECIGFLTSLKTLDVSHSKLKALPDCIGFLTSLQSLTFDGKLKALPECIGFLTSLQSLQVSSGNLEALPESIGFLTSLQHLRINGSKFKSLPESMYHLTSLTSLAIHNASNELWERCLPNGQDRPKICHIPDLAFYY
ncbi:Disease resistance protein RGA2 [Bienertia sinuspersici]